MKKQKNSKKIILGITGSLATGKSTVANIFRAYGATLIDADRIAHEVIKPQGAIYKKIVAFFGRGILGKRKTIDRQKLARIVFSDQKALKKLNHVMHPEIIRMIKERIKETDASIIVLDAPLLIEAGLGGLVDRLVVVKCNLGEQLSRLRDRHSGLSRSDALKVIHCQIPLKEKVSLADFVIDNSGTVDNTKRQVEKIYQNLLLPKLRRVLWRS